MKLRNLHYIICAIGGHPNDKATRSGHVPNRDESHVLLVFSPSERAECYCYYKGGASIFRMMLFFRGCRKNQQETTTMIETPF